MARPSSTLSARIVAVSAASRLRIAAAVLALSGCATLAGGDDLGSNGQLFVVTLDGERARLTDDERSYSSPSWSPDSSRLAVAASDSDRGVIEIVDANGGGQQTLIGGGGPGASTLSWSPIGGLVGFALHTDEGVTVGVVRPDGSGQRILAGFSSSRTGNPAGPSWSPDGRSLAYSPLRADGGLRVVDVLTGAERRLTHGLVFDPRWSPDGTAILFERSSREAVGLFAARVAGGAPRTVGPRLVSAEPEWSPDGRTVALSGVTFAGDRRYHLYVLDVRRRTLRALDGEIMSTRPAWSPDGRLVAVSDYEGRVLVIEPDGSERRTLTELEGAEIRDLAWSPDGRRLAFVARVVPPD
jgi:Tol biopolymer transport system component